MTFLMNFAYIILIFIMFSHRQGWPRSVLARAHKAVPVSAVTSPSPSGAASCQEPTLPGGGRRGRPGADSSAASSPELECADQGLED